MRDPVKRQEGGQNSGDRKTIRPEADVGAGNRTGGCDENGEGSFSPTEAPTTPTDRVDGEATLAFEARETTTTGGAMVSSTEPDDLGKLDSIPRGENHDRSQVVTPARTIASTATATCPPTASSANSSEVPHGKRGVAAGPRLEYMGDAATTTRSARDRSSNFEDAAPSSAPSVREVEEAGGASSSSLYVPPSGHSAQSATSGEENVQAAVAPAESLVRLKRRRQPPRTRSNT